MNRQSLKDALVMSRRIQSDFFREHLIVGDLTGDIWWPVRLKSDSVLYTDPDTLFHILFPGASLSRHAEHALWIRGGTGTIACRLFLRVGLRNAPNGLDLSLRDERNAYSRICREFRAVDLFSRSEESASISHAVSSLMAVGSDTYARHAEAK